jgi:hypothetical protein
LRREPGLGEPAIRGPRQAQLAGVEEGESGVTAKPLNFKGGVNCDASAGKARAKQEGESGITAKPLNRSDLEDSVSDAKAEAVRRERAALKAAPVLVLVVDRPPDQVMVQVDIEAPAERDH